MPTVRPLRASLLAVALLLASGLAPVFAAGDQLIPVTKPADLQIPAAQLPGIFTPEKGQTLTDPVMAPLIGLHMLTIFHQSGLIAGYHGWLDGKDPTGAQFVTYDLYAFSAIKGARNARLAYQQLVLGVPLQNTDPSLPKSATIWTDGTGTFGPNNEPFAVAEIVFRVANVVGDITGYYAGGDAGAANEALHNATVATVACVHWLSSRLPAAGHASLLPLLPFVAAPEAARRRWRRRVR